MRFATEHPGARTRYILHNPGFVDTGMADPLPQPMRSVTKLLARHFAMPVSKAIVPIVGLLDHPPEAPVTAFRRGKPLPLRGKDFDPVAAERLHHLTTDLLTRGTAPCP